jgi:AcrR family transcriptional regulator
MPTYHPGMARRGDQLREHILWTAKEVFLELGFERASMDEVARRASTSKRSLYAHYDNKEALFAAVIELVRGLFLLRIRMPRDYADKPIEAITQFLARYLESMLYEPAVQLFRVTTAEIARFPNGAAQHHDVLFGEVEKRLGHYLKSTYALSVRASAEQAQRLIARVLYPRFPRALFGLEDLVTELDATTLSPKIDVRAIRRLVTDEIGDA